MAGSLAEKMGVVSSERWVQRDAEMKALGRRMERVLDAVKAYFMERSTKEPGCANHGPRFRRLMAEAEKGEMRQLEEAVTQAEGGKR